VQRPGLHLALPALVFAICATAGLVAVLLSTASQQEAQLAGLAADTKYTARALISTLKLMQQGTTVALGIMAEKAAVLQAAPKLSLGFVNAARVTTCSLWLCCCHCSYISGLILI
jgi:hypothetical protein